MLANIHSQTDLYQIAADLVATEQAEAKLAQITDFKSLQLLVTDLVTKFATQLLTTDIIQAQEIFGKDQVIRTMLAELVAPYTANIQDHDNIGSNLTPYTNKLFTDVELNQLLNDNYTIDLEVTSAEFEATNSPSWLDFIDLEALLNRATELDFSQLITQDLKNSKQQANLVSILQKILKADLLDQAMSYSLLGSGKMMRPMLVFIAGMMFGAKVENLLIASLAIEAVHTYSLIHDDLPAMDNDDYRRGRLTNHKVFGEDHAILAGDALQTFAFSLLSSNNGLEASQIVKQVQVLAYGAGHLGMCLGQSYDILSEVLNSLFTKTTLNLTSPQTVIAHYAKLGVNVDQVQAEQILADLGNFKQKLISRLSEIHYRKTAFLIRTSVLLGLNASQAYNDEQIQNLFAKWAYTLGLAFQVRDDILDVIGNQEEIGKPVGSDIANNKLTFVSLLGLEATQQISADFLIDLNEQFRGFEQYLQQTLLDPTKSINYNSQAFNWLQEITWFVINRNS